MNQRRLSFLFVCIFIFNMSTLATVASLRNPVTPVRPQLATDFSLPLRPTLKMDHASTPVSHFCELVQFATLAASSHNTQCWRFKIDTKSITIVPDLDRACPIVDGDNHHLFVSLGCALENLLVAANFYGYNTKVDASHPAENGIRVQLTKAGVHGSDDVIDTSTTEELFKAISKRQVSRCEYNGEPLSSCELDQLRAAGTGKGVKVLLITDPQEMKTILYDHILPANTEQMTDTAFMKELGTWVRFNQGHAVLHGDGLYGQCTGNPSIPKILGSYIFPFVARPGPENNKIIKQVHSSAGFAIFVSEDGDDDPTSRWVEVGRCYERFALRATRLEVQNAFLNQPVEVESRRPALVKLLGLNSNEHPDLIVRFGKGPEMPMSPRRPVVDVIDLV